MNKLSIGLTFIFLSFLVQADSDINNEAFSFIGFGVGEISYSESGILSSGVKFKTTPSTTNIFNQSGGYSPIGKKYGFYINTLSTLTSSNSNEYWQALGTVTKGELSNSVDGIYQENVVSSSQNELHILLSYMFKPGHQVIAGGSYNKTLWDRNSFTNGEDIDDFNNAHLTPAVGNEDVIGQGAEDLNNNGLLDLNELTSYYGVSPEDSIVNFTETFTSSVLQLGYFYDSRFIKNANKLRLIGGVSFGLPLYYSVNNTSRAQMEFTDSFNGYNLRGYAGIGWRFTKSIGVLAKFEYSYRTRDEVVVGLGYNEELQRERNALIPENEIEYWNASIVTTWNF